MPFYRLPDNSVAGFFLGTEVLALIAVITGEYSIRFAFRLNREIISRDNHRIEHFQNLSFEALKSGDKSAFRACNGIANEAYGKSFFTQIALSAASLWPLFIALGWMQYRFSGIEIQLPVPGHVFSIGYVSSFIVSYVLSRVLFYKIMSFPFLSTR